MAQNGAVIVFCFSCKILYFASPVHPKIATVLRKSRAGEFLAGTFKRARMKVIKQQDRK